MSQDLESSIALGIHLVHVQGVVMHLRQVTHIITFRSPLVVVVPTSSCQSENACWTFLICAKVLPILEICVDLDLI